LHEKNATDISGQPLATPDSESRSSSNFVLSRQDVWLKKNWTDATFNFCYRGSYSTALTDYLARQTEYFAFVDIGANQGLYSLIAVQSELCDQALAFEPVLKTFRLLEDNIRANHNGNRIRAFRLAVSDHTGAQAISTRIGHSGAATLRNVCMSLLCGTEMIQSIGPEFLKAQKPAKSEIIKIDVEGHEEIVVQILGEAGYLDSARAVYYEIDTRWSDADRLTDTLRAHGFRHFVQNKPGRHYDVLATR